MWGIDEGAEGLALYRYLVAELDELGALTFTSCMAATSNCWATYARCGSNR